MTKIAFIDFDGTARRGDSIVDYIKYLLKQKKISIFDALYAVWMGMLYFLHIRDEKFVKERSLRFLSRFSEEEINKFSRDFVRDVLKHGIFQEMHELVDELHDDGYKVVIISASPDVYMRYINDIMLAEDVISTKFNLKNCRIYGRNCKGDEKVFMIKSYLHDNYPDCDLANCAGFGDSRSDLPMLNIMGKKCFVNNYRLYNEFVHTKDYDLKYWLN